MTTNPLAEILPPPTQHLTYPGNRTGSLGRVMGPMLADHHQMLTVVDETHDPDTNTTRLGLAYGIIQLEQEPTT